MIEILVNISGWCGTGLFLVAYYLVSTEKLSATAPAYQVINLFGAMLLGVNVFYQKSWPGLALEVIWSAIAIQSLIKNRPKVSK